MVSYMNTFKNSFNQVFEGKKVLVTGHTGFKGSWLSLWLDALGAKVVGISKGLPSTPSNYEVCKLDQLVESHLCDVRDFDRINSIINESKPDFIFHLAAQPLVRLSYKDPLETFSVNALGSANILESLRNLEKKVNVVMITSDKAYDNVEWEWGYRESDKLGGKDPYSASKGMAELVIRSYHSSYFSSQESNVRIGVSRAGNVIGGGDWASDRIIPDCMKAWSEENIVKIRNPVATRPWQHVLEPLSGYLTQALALERSNELNGEAFNFGPPSDQNHSVEDLILEMSNHWEKVKWESVTPDSSMHEAGLLKLNCDKAIHFLNWQPTLSFEETVKFTVDWYRAYYNSPENILKISLAQLNSYFELANSRDRSWIND